jgi:hypothetical protein
MLNIVKVEANPKKHSIFPPGANHDAANTGV